MKIHRLLLPTEEREILKVSDDINAYWKNLDNFNVALSRYLEDLSFKYSLGLSKVAIQEITNKLAIRLFSEYDLSYANTIYVFAQFIIFFIFKGLSPRHLLANADEILNIVLNIEYYLTPAESRLAGFKVVLTKNQKRKAEEFWFLGGAYTELFAYCSDNGCPCSQTKIPRNEGYIYVVDNGNGKITANLTCEQGAILRNLNLRIAKNDAKQWWVTGMVPFRPTPKDDQVSNSPTFPDFTDSRDGCRYKTVKIGNQVWMSENLRYIPRVYPSTIPRGRDGIWVYDYEGSDTNQAKATDNYKKYGCLYNWLTALEVCPQGWHLPSDDEWTDQAFFLSGPELAGGKLKSVTGWESPNIGSTNESGFSALPGGCRSNPGFWDIGRDGTWWSSSMLGSSTTVAIYYNLNYDLCSLNRRSVNSIFEGYSIRCLKD